LIAVPSQQCDQTLLGRISVGFKYLDRMWTGCNPLWEDPTLTISAADLPAPVMARPLFLVLPD
jgi:hypothetical protein